MEFDVIYADPPWNFTTWSEKGQGRSPNYKVMTKTDLAMLEVAELRKKNCVLFLWSTWPHLKNALDIMAAWGFDYKTNAWTWFKNKMAKGYYTRKKTEICLLGVRGSMPVAVHNVDDVIFADVLHHSQKPFEAYEKIDQLYPLDQYPKRVELFASKHSMKLANSFSFIPLGYDVNQKDIQDEIRSLRQL